MCELGKLRVDNGLFNMTGFEYETLVELRGFEPLASSLRTRRATNCATAPEPRSLAD
jgi:hypothetical protein